MGEIMVLINHCCGYKTWRQIEWKDFDKIQQFVKNNAVNYLKIVDPDFAIKFENYNPMDDQFLIKHEEWCPGMVKDLLAPYQKKINLKPRTEF